MWHLYFKLLMFNALFDLWRNKSWELRSFSVWNFWPGNVRCQVYDKYYSCSLYSTVKVLILSHISVWRLGLKISRSCPVLKYLVSIVNMIVKEQLKIERIFFIKMISTKMISTTMISIKLSSGRRNLEFPAAARGAGSQDDPAGKAA